MKTLGEIRKEREDSVNELMKRTGVFFAFSNKQFEENRTPLREGEKYVSIGAGGYLPKGNYEEFHAGFAAIDKQYNAAIDENNLADAEILYELYNHECFYTGDYADVFEMFEGRYDHARIMLVAFNEQRKKGE